MSASPIISNPLIVLLHGFMGDRRDLEPLRRTLAAQLFDCISVDLPGHGDSARLGHCQAAAEAVAAEIDMLAHGRSLLFIGYSMGGRLALQLASNRAARIAGVIVLSSNPGIEVAAQRSERAARDEQLAGRLRSMTPAHFASWLRDEWYRAPLWGTLHSHPHFEEMLLRRTDGVRPADRAASLERESVGLQPSLWQWLDSATLPLLFVAGSLDSAYAPMARRILGQEAASSSLFPMSADGFAAAGSAAVGSAAAGSAAAGLAAPHQGGVKVKARTSAALVDAAAHALLLEAPERVAELCCAWLRGLDGRGLDGQSLDSCSCPSAIPRQPAGAAEAAGAGAMRLTCAPRLKAFSLCLTAPLPLSRGAPLVAREGHLLLVSGSTARAAADDAAAVESHGVGELCPLPCFHKETCEEAHEQLSRVCASLVGRLVPFELLQLGGAMRAWLNAPELLPSVRCAIESALLHMLARSCRRLVQQPSSEQPPSHTPTPYTSMPSSLVRSGGAPLGGIAHALATSAGESRCEDAPQSHVRLNGLMARGETAAAEAAAAEVTAMDVAPGRAGSILGRMRTWKLKVGGGPPEEEGERISRLLAGCAALGLRMRLDANQAWSREDAHAFCTALRAGWRLQQKPQEAELQANESANVMDTPGGVAHASKRSRSEAPVPLPTDAAPSGVVPAGAAPTEAALSEAVPFPPPALEFCEEPLHASLGSELSAMHLADGLRYALDESVTPVAEEICRSAPCPGSFDGGPQPSVGPRLIELRARLAASGCAALVLKPTLLGGPEVTASLASEASACGLPVVLTSAFESGVTHAHVAILASVVGGASVAHGLSTYERLASDVLSPPFAHTVVGGDLVDVSMAQAALDATADALAMEL